ncbi:dsRBD fold-containing protein [Streptomyces coelicoflavus]|uniref:dsRBD fold-containing protein n=1 Tax=Streptomyces coelicoflavus TaxID=285562 RepID=UPI0027E31561|nr:dsRBD fold-containing protein [Streptomyces coelicoflavus]
MVSQCMGAPPGTVPRFPGSPSSTLLASQGGDGAERVVEVAAGRRRPWSTAARAATAPRRSGTTNRPVPRDRRPHSGSRRGRPGGRPPSRGQGCSTAAARLLDQRRVRHHAADANVPEIGDDLAAGRGLRSIARQLLDIAERDIAATRATRPVSG